MEMSTPLDSLSSSSVTITSVKKQAFSSSEKELLVELVRERPIIEDKRTNAKNIQLKKQAWEELTVAYNSQPFVCQRNSVQLKRCWENIKTLRKKELSQESIYIRGTGGGPSLGGPEASSNNIVDLICPFIDLRVPGVIDSNTTEISADVNSNLHDLIQEVSDKGKLLAHDIQQPNINRNKRKLDGEDTSLKDAEVVTKEIINLNESNPDSPPQLKRQMKREIFKTPTFSGMKKYHSEIEARIKRCSVNIQQDQILHELRVQREKILLDRETNLLDFEKRSQELQIEKLNLEIKILKNKIDN